jgi:hypothetical protein
MPIKFVCPKCNTTLQVSDAMAGKQGKCKCGNVVAIPAASSAVPAAAKPVAQSSTPGASRPAGAPSVAGNPRPAGSPQVSQTAAPAVPMPNIQLATTSASTRNVGSLLDEITESDFKSKAVVPRPDAVPTKKSETALLKKFTAADDYQVAPVEVSGRPGGLIILSVLNFLGALGAIGLIVLALGATAILSQAAETQPFLKLTGLLAAIGVVALIVSLTVGIGLLTRIQAFWWMAITAYSVNLCSGLTSALLDLVMPDPNGNTNLSVSYGKAFGSAVVGIMILYYLYSPKVIKWFDVKFKLGIAFAITFSIGLLLGGGGAYGMRVMADQVQPVEVSPDVGQ